MTKPDGEPHASATRAAAARHGKSRKSCVPARVTLAIASLASTGCDVLRDDRWTFLWLALSSLVAAIGASGWAWWRRGRQLTRWDLASEAQDPGVRSIWLSVWISVAILIVGFTIYNYRIEDLDPKQFLLNSGLWALGAIVGAAGGLWVGLRQAEQV